MVWLLLLLFKLPGFKHSHSVRQHHYNTFETDPRDTHQAERQQVRSLMLLQSCNANRRVEGLSLLFIIILLVTKTSALKIQSRLKLGRQKNPCPQQERIVKSKPTKNVKARNDPKAQGCIRTCVCMHWREKRWRVTDRREKLQEQLPRYQGKI